LSALVEVVVNIRCETPLTPILLAWIIVRDQPEEENLR